MEEDVEYDVGVDFVGRGTRENDITIDGRR